MWLPFILSAPATAIIGETCYKSLIADFNYRDTACIRYSLSKGLGLGIVFGGAIVKIPQIVKIVRAQSAKGLSLSSYLLETTASVISVAYNVRHRNPISTFGEAFFVTLQNLAIVGLMLHYRGRTSTGLAIVFGFFSLGFILGKDIQYTDVDGTVSTLGLVPPALLVLLQAMTIPISLFSRIPQIAENYRNGSTGQLAAFTVFNYCAGSLARVYTTMVEVDDWIILSGAIFNALLNGILALQMAMYWDSKNQPSRVKLGEMADGSLYTTVPDKTKVQAHKVD
ncbi:hypothetical protein BG004_000067 [Podila humilis]|nr:hypothetical protein BG004_000067 [Podila humilis]